VCKSWILNRKLKLKNDAKVTMLKFLVRGIRNLAPLFFISPFPWGTRANCGSRSRTNSKALFSPVWLSRSALKKALGPALSLLKCFQDKFLSRIVRHPLFVFCWLFVYSSALEECQSNSLLHMRNFVYFTFRGSFTWMWESKSRIEIQQ